MTSFGDGEFRVGVDIAPGLYRAVAPSEDCDWSRALDSGSPQAELGVLGRIPVEQPLSIVEIAASDTSFTSSGCGGWSEVIAEALAPVETFGDGTFLVGPEVTPGRYRATGSSDSCYWLRLDGVGAVRSTERPDDWNTTRLMALEWGAVVGDRYPIVDIASSDGGFFSDGCGTWSSDLTVAVTPDEEFGDGLFLVGSEIASGRYRAIDPSNGCHWVRLNHFGGELSAWYGWDNFAISMERRSDVRPVVDIGATDAAFYSRGCGTWSSELTPIASPGESFGDGTFIVGVDIASGRYRTTTASEDCVWFRLYDFGGIYGAYEGFNATARGRLGIVDIAPTDAGFTSRGCGTWSPDLTSIAMPDQFADDGTYLVGTDIAPGRYFASDPGGACSWTRLRSFGGDTSFGYDRSDDIVGYGSLAIVDILKIDAGFRTSGCGTWSAVAAQVSEPKRSFRDGTYIVGRDIAPGRYFANAPPGRCEWDRLDAFDGYDRKGDIGIGGGRGHNLPSKLAVVDIKPSDVGFHSSGCGEWTQTLEPRATPGEPPGDGFFLVGVEVEPGRYRARTPWSCTFERRSEFSGSYYEENRYIDEGSAGRGSELAVVDIEPTDAGFQSEGCGWSADLSATTQPGQPVGDGTHVVGSDVAPGRYRARPTGDLCSWTRLSKFGGLYGNDTGVVGRWWVRGQSAVVDIAPTDIGFFSEGCGEWSPDLSPFLTAGEPFSRGTYLVGSDLAPGRYRATPENQKWGCYWARLSGFGGTKDEVLGWSDFLGTSFIAEIDPSDVGFTTDGDCGAWVPDDRAPLRSISEPIGAGVYHVGTEITPGRYRASSQLGEASCQWWRLAGFGGAPEEVLGSYDLGLIYAYSFIVDIEATDAGFASTRCGTWTTDLTPIVSPGEAFRSGSWLVGPEVSPGRYRNTPGETDIRGNWNEHGCEWQRVSGFGGTEVETIEAGSAEVGTVVTVAVAATDIGFVSRGCGTWNLVPP